MLVAHLGNYLLVVRYGNSINNLHHKLANTLNVALLCSIALIAVLDPLAEFRLIDLAMQTKQLELGFAQLMQDTKHAVLVEPNVMHHITQLLDGVEQFLG